MKKTFTLAALLAALGAGSAHADFIKVAVNGGYATVDMKDVNGFVDDMKKSDDSMGLTAKKNTRLGSAYFVAAEAGLGMMPFLEIGPRVEYLAVTPMEYRSETTGYFKELNVDATLTSFMLGVTTGLDLPLTGLGFQVAGYAGHGYAVARSTYTSTLGGQAAQYTGGGFVSQLEAKLKYSILPLVSLDAVAGLRFAAVGVLSDGSKPTSQSFDFSGINAGGGVTVGF